MRSTRLPPSGNIVAVVPAVAPLLFSPIVAIVRLPFCLSICLSSDCVCFFFCVACFLLLWCCSSLLLSSQIFVVTRRHLIFSLVDWIFFHTHLYTYFFLSFFFFLSQKVHLSFSLILRWAYWIYFPFSFVLYWNVIIFSYSYARVHKYIHVYSQLLKSA